MCLFIEKNSIFLTMPHNRLESFKNLGIADELLGALHDLGFQKPTDIQEKTIPLVLQGKDVIAKSATGSGKTLVFGAGIIQNLQSGTGLQALVLTPTRELAEQVAKTLESFAQYKQLNIVTVYG